MLELLWKSLFLIKLYYLFYIILFYFVIPMKLWLGILLRFYVVIEPINVWQLEQPILLIILIIMLFRLMLLSLVQMLLSPFYLLMSLDQMLLSPFYLFVIMIHNVPEPCRCQGVTRAIVLCS